MGRFAIATRMNADGTEFHRELIRAHWSHWSITAEPPEPGPVLQLGSGVFLVNLCFGHEFTSPTIGRQELISAWHGIDS